jgi:hypothetical protein
VTPTASELERHEERLSALESGAETGVVWRR